MTDGCDDVEARIRRYLNHHPDAGVADILGGLTLSPEHRELVEEVLSGEASEGWLPESIPALNAGVWSTLTEEMTSLMCTRLENKNGFGPEGPRQNPNAECKNTNDGCAEDAETTADEGCHCDPRYRWKLPENWIDFETAQKWARMDPSLSEAIIAVHQREGEAYREPADPGMFFDGDGVIDKHGTIHPGFRDVVHDLTTGPGYASVSSSGHGAHVPAIGRIPDGEKQLTITLSRDVEGFDTSHLDDDDEIQVEIFDGKKLRKATGKQIKGTPREPTEIDSEALAEYCDEYGSSPSDPADAVRAYEPFDSTEHTPTATDRGELTDDIRDVFVALDRLDARQVAADTIVHRWNNDANTSDGKRAFIPIWGKSANGTANVVDRNIWQDTGGNGYGGPVVMALIAAGELPESATPRDARRGTWLRGVELLRDHGYDIPKYTPTSTDDCEHIAVFPAAVRDLSTATSGWDWKHAAKQSGATITVEDARERTVEAIANAYTSGNRVLVEALPTMGKSYGAIKAAAETGQQVTILTGRGHKEQYDQFRTWCEEHSLDYYTLPSFTRDCSTANGDHGEEWADTVRGWYNRGATPKAIHKSAEYELGRPLPCQEHEGQRCPYASKWEFDPDEYDVLIGHYTHAHKSKVTKGRICVFDEFPDAYETLLGGTLQGAVSYWLNCTDAVPFEDYTDLLENRAYQQRRADALLWFEEHGVEPDETHVFDDTSAHAVAPLAVFTILASEDLGNGFEHARLDDWIGVRNRKKDTVSILRPPALDYASGVVALDGTPTKRMWELALGGRLNHRPVLQDAERVEYVRDALNLNLVRTTDHIKPYNSADHINTEQDAALLEEIAENHDEQPAVITSATAEHEYDADGILDLVDETKHYGNVLGSNEFDVKRVGAVIGSNHYGDHYIKKWCAYAGKAVERGEEKGAALSYGGFGDDVLQHMREHDTLQAAMRFGRDGNGAVVYVHTDTLPEWVPVVGEGRVLTTWSDGMRDVVRALEDLGAATTAAIVDHPAIDLSRQQVFAHLETLRERGFLTREQDAKDGRRVVWIDDSLHRLNEHGDVELETAELTNLDDDEVRQLARSTLYTWEFTNFAPERDGPPTLSGRSPVATSQPPVNGGDPPPDHVD